MVDISNIDTDAVISTKTTVINIEINKCIQLTYLKEGRAKRTYVYGLEHFITDQKKIKQYVKSLQVDLATSLVENEDGEGRKRFGFNGKHGQKIKEKLMTDLKIGSDKIECNQIS